MWLIVKCVGENRQVYFNVATVGLTHKEKWSLCTIRSKLTRRYI